MITVLVIGIDQSTKATGVSVYIDGKLSEYFPLLVADKHKIIENGKSKSVTKTGLERIREMFFLINQTLNKYNPECVFFEQVQFQNNYGSFQQLSQLQGTILALLFNIDCGFRIIESSAWRSFCGVKGRKRIEQKASAIQMVKDKFGIEASEDVCEAILIGYFAVHNIGEIK